jgi:hypothetical protein
VSIDPDAAVRIAREHKLSLDDAAALARLADDEDHAHQLVAAFVDPPSGAEQMAAVLRRGAGHAPHAPPADAPAEPPKPPSFDAGPQGVSVRAPRDPNKVMGRLLRRRGPDDFDLDDIA